VLSCPPQLTVTSNRELLEHAILNLAVNALHHTECGTVEVVAERRGDGGVMIDVRDPGPGIPPEYHQRVFERFYRMEAGQSGGFGLGLAITREAVEALGGRVLLESTPSVGTTVRLELPNAAGG
jgi:signal transduction histidine kinase